MPNRIHYSGKHLKKYVSRTISKHKTYSRLDISLNYLVLAIFLSIPSAVGFADVVSFLVDPDTIDSNNDGFITGDEFQPIGSGGTIFDFTPTNHLVSFPRFQLSSRRGLRYGGGGGSSLEFTVLTKQGIFLPVLSRLKWLVPWCPNLRNESW